MSNQNVYIVAGKRTPVGSFLGGLSTVSAVQLGANAVKAALEQTGLKPEQVDELYMGNVVPANLGQAPATQVALAAGLLDTTPCTIVNKVCASGTKSVMLAAQSILLGMNDVVVAGGMENMSLIPFYATTLRSGYKFGNTQLLDGIVRDGLQDPFNQNMMGNAGEICAREFNISREEQDEYAVRSYHLAEKAMSDGLFNDEISPVTVKLGKKEVVVDKDEEPGNVRYDKIPNLRPAFEKEGTITAANASKINDGAAAVILASESAVEKYGLKPIAKIVSFADAAKHPDWFTIAPADAIPKAVERGGLQMKDIDLYEINEAFSVVAIANQKLMKAGADQINSRSGAVALGHPIGMSGTRLVISLANSLKEQNAKYGAVGICNGGGGASALILEKV